MTQTAPVYSDDQAEAHDRIAEMLRAAGVDLDEGLLTPPNDDESAVLAVIGKAGSGKTLLLASLFHALAEAGVEVVSGDWEGKPRPDRRTLAILAPTNKAASVLRMRGVPATTIHRILYTPVYDPEYERIADWLTGEGERPQIEGLTDAALDRALAFYQSSQSVPGALATAGLRGSDFITGWKRREAPLDIGLVDEASMLDARQLDDLKEIFPTLVLFGDPAQLPPVKSEGNGGMVFETLPAPARLELHRIHRQAADNPILDLAHALGDPDLGFEDFETPDRGYRAPRRTGALGAKGRGRPDGALARAGVAQRHAHPPDPRLPRGPRRAGGCAVARRATDLRRDRAAAQIPRQTA